MERLLGLFLLLWMGSGVNGQGTMHVFINDLIATFQATFQLASPTIIYDSNEGVPEICYASQWVLCLSSSQHERDIKEFSESHRQSEPETQGTIQNVVQYK